MLRILPGDYGRALQILGVKDLPNDKVDGHGDEAVEQVVAVGQQAGHELPPRPEAVEEQGLAKSLSLATFRLLYS